MRSAGRTLLVVACALAGPALSQETIPLGGRVFSDPGPTPSAGTYPFETDSPPQLTVATLGGKYRILATTLYVRGTPNCVLDAIEVVVDGQVVHSSSFGAISPSFPSVLPVGWQPTIVFPSLPFAYRSVGEPFVYPDGLTELRLGDASFDLPPGGQVEVSLRIRGTVPVTVVGTSRSVGFVEARFSAGLSVKGPGLHFQQTPPDVGDAPLVFPDSVPAIEFQHEEYPPGGELQIYSLNPELATVDGFDSDTADVTVHAPGVATIRAEYQTPAGWPDIEPQLLTGDAELPIAFLGPEIVGPTLVQAGQTYTWSIATTLNTEPFPGARFIWSAISPDGGVIEIQDAPTASLTLVALSGMTGRKKE